jgi:hypothetical protein
MCDGAIKCRGSSTYIKDTDEINQHEFDSSAGTVSHYSGSQFDVNKGQNKPKSTELMQGRISP